MVVGISETLSSPTEGDGQVDGVADAARRLWAQRHRISFSIGMLIGVLVPLAVSAVLSSSTVFRGHRSDARAYLRNNEASGTPEEIEDTLQCWNSTSAQMIHTCDTVALDTFFGPITVGGGAWYTLTHNFGVLLVASVVTWLVYNFLFHVLWTSYINTKMQTMINAALFTEKDKMLQSKRGRLEEESSDSEDDDFLEDLYEMTIEFADTLTAKAIEVRRELLGAGFIMAGAGCRLLFGGIMAVVSILVMVVVVESTRGNVGEDVFAVVETTLLTDQRRLGIWEGRVAAQSQCVGANGTFEVAASAPPADSGAYIAEVIARSEAKGQFGRRLLAWLMGFTVGGGVLGSPLFYMWKESLMGSVPGAKETSRETLFTLAGTCGVGFLVGTLCLLVEISLEFAQESMMDVRAFTGEFMNRAETVQLYPDGSYFDVQLTKLARESQGHFRSSIVQQFVVALCCLVWDVFVVSHHFITTPHPKFRLRLPRRISIYTHICSGSAEIVTAVISFCLYDSGLPNDSWRTYVTYVNVCCSFVHALTGGYQVRIYHNLFISMGG
jgi:hypothetical protein